MDAHVMTDESHLGPAGDKAKNNRDLKPSAYLTKEEMGALLGPDLDSQKNDARLKTSTLAALIVAVILAAALFKFNTLSKEPELPKLPPPQIAAAYAAMEKGLYNESLALLGQAAATKDIDLAMVDRLRAQALLGRAGRQLAESPEAAVYDLLSAAELAPEWPEVYLQTGRVMTRLQRMDEALAFYNKALTLDPNMDIAWFNSGYIHLTEKRFAQAIEAFQKVVKLGSPFTADAYVNSAICQIKMGQLGQAEESLRRALAKNPNHALARKYLDKLLDHGNRG